MTHADGMMIPFHPTAKLFEPVQKALIGWNGQEELLLLTVDVRASEATKVLQVVPFPSEPKVSAGDIGPFLRAIRVINNAQQRQSRRAGPPSSDDYGKAEPRPVARITQRQQIGVHQLSVVQVLSAEHFVAWVTDMLRKEGITGAKLPDWVHNVIATYLKEGIRWFVFDSFELVPELRQVEPLRYRFATDRLFYPLRITRVEEGSSVDLTIVTRQLFTRFPALPGRRIRLLHSPFAIPLAQVESIDPELAALFAGGAPVHLRLWHIADTDNGFDQDLLAY